MGGACLIRCEWFNGIHAQRDFYAKIAAAFAYRIAQVLEFHLPIRVRVGDNYVATATPHQFIESQVFKMPAVRKVNEAAAIRSVRKKLKKEIENTQVRRRRILCPTPRIA